MSSPFAYGSPRIPPVPQSTPITSSKPYFLNRPRAPRPPVVNPYDKFSQTEFDDWISGITGALRKALGHETDEPDRTTVESDSASAVFHEPAIGIYAPSDAEEHEEYETDAEGVNDSLADIRSRFNARLDKGKARDPMEGPGLPLSGKGDKGAPIEIDLDDDESGSDKDEGVGQFLQEDDTSYDSDILDDEEVALHLSFVQPSDEEDEEPDNWHLPQSSLRNEVDLKEGDERQEDEYEEESDESEGGSSLSEGQRGSDNVIELLSSEDEGVAQVSTLAQRVASEDDYYSGSEDEGEDIRVRIHEDVDEEGRPSYEPEQVNKPSRAPVYRSGLETMSSDEKKGPEEDIGEEEDIEEEEQEGTDGEEVYEQEIANIEEEDEGEDSEEMEEEYDQLGLLGGRRKPSPEVINLDSDVEEDQLNGDSDDVQPPEHDISFPPRGNDMQTPIEIRNPWIGPQTYAEDYYAGGPILPQEQDAPHNPHFLGANDDREDFLTPEDVTPAESNGREVSAAEELRGQEPSHLPRLQFIHSRSIENWSEIPPEMEFTAAAVSTIEVHSTRDESPSEPIVVETQGGTHDAIITNSAQGKELISSPKQSDKSVPLEASVAYVQSSQEPARDDEKALRQTEAVLDGAYEGVDGEVASESQEEQDCLQLEGANEVPRPLHRKVPSVTVEEVTDEEAENECFNEADDIQNSPVPLGVRDLGVSPIAEGGQPSIPSNDMSSLAEANPKLAVDIGETEDPLANALLVGIAETGLSQEFSDLEGSAASEPIESHISEVLEPVGQTIQSPLLLSVSLPATDFVDIAIESEPEQQQLPTPPAEQEIILQYAALRYSQPETVVEEDSAIISSVAEGKEVVQQDSTATLIERSPMPTAVTSEKEESETSTGDAEKEPANAPTMVAVFVEQNVPETVDVDEKILDELFADSSVPIAPASAELTLDVAIEEVTEDVPTMDVDDCLAIVEEIPSKAASEEPGFFAEHTAIETFSKEGSVISLPYSDASGVSPGLPYLIEELPDDEVTDDDADGEVDPDLPISSTQYATSSRKWDDLADEIFDEKLWDLGEPLSPPVEVVQTTIVYKKDSTCHSTEQSESTVVQENQPDSQLGSTSEKPAESTQPVLSSGGFAADEDDIASSREASPSPNVVERSASPATHVTERSQGSAVPPPQSSPSGSEKELYGDKNRSTGSKNHEVESIDEASPFAKGTTSDVDADDASTTIPGLTLTTSLRPSSPIPGLGARLLEEGGTEAVDSEIPGLTWSKTFPSLLTGNGCSMPIRSASLPQTTTFSSLSPLSLQQAHEWLVTHVPYTITRRATEPILFSDPYPYSLSTPGLDSAKDEAGNSEDEEEQDMSMSSSSTSISVEKDSEREIGEPVLETNGNVGRKLTVAASPPAGNESGEVESRPLYTLEDLVEPVETNDGYFINFIDVDQDRDADGDLDPDFLVLPDSAAGSNEKSTLLTEASGDAAAPEVVDVSSDARDGTSNIPPEIVPERPSEAKQYLSNGILSDTATEVDPKVTREVVAPSLILQSGEAETPDAQMDKSRSTSLEFPTAEQACSHAARQKEVAHDTATCFSPQSLSPLPGADGANGPRKQTSSKRKRSSTPEPGVAAQDANDRKKSQSTQSAKPQSLQRHDRIKRPRISSSLNEKLEDSDDDSILSSELTAPSDDDVSSVADRLLRGDSAELSRTPTTALSPATKNTAEHFYPMLHRHGRGAKNQNKKEQLLSSQRPIQRTQSAPSGSRSSDKSQEPLHIASASQRATRSNCRYRKISVPREEEGPRVCFLVPGCSLGDEEVVEENEIEDLGEATYADSLRMVRDIESLFDSYLIGVLRQLVGVDLLREQEVFYLPAPGEEPVVRKPLPKKNVSDKYGLGKKPSKSSNIETSSVLNTPSHSVTSISVKSPSSSKAPISLSSTTSTFISTARKYSRHERDSLTPASSLSLSLSDEEKGSDDNERRPPKPWPKHSHKMERGKHSESSMKGGKISKRGRRLTSDALAYKPHSDSDNASSADENATRLPRRKLVARRDLKRTRSGKTFAVSEEADGREAKKIKRDR